MRSTDWILMMIVSAGISAGVSVAVHHYGLDRPESSPPPSQPPIAPPPASAPAAPSPAAGQVEVPDLVGLSPDQARTVLEARGLLYVLEAEREDDKVPPGKISVQSPLPGSTVLPGGSVKVSAAKASAKTAVPDVRRRPLSKAKELITQSKLVVGAIKYRYDEDVDEGRVLEQKPAAGEKVSENTPIDLVVNREN